MVLEHLSPWICYRQKMAGSLSQIAGSLLSFSLLPPCLVSYLEPSPHMPCRFATFAPFLLLCLFTVRYKILIIEFKVTSAILHIFLKVSREEGQGFMGEHRSSIEKQPLKKLWKMLQKENFMCLS
uniref:Uncharacterized protein n=1 Tax=Lotus japonicus TaxID=34305 RepID=I3T5V2_LOTJA|nr:unknown [Lotus japonicus]